MDDDGQRYVCLYPKCEATKMSTLTQMDEDSQNRIGLYPKREVTKMDEVTQKYNNCLYTECKGGDSDCVGKIENVSGINMPNGCGVGIHPHVFYGSVNYNVLSITKAATRKFKEVDHETIDELLLIQKKMEELVQQAAKLVENKAVLDESIHDSVNAIDDVISWMESHDYDPLCYPVDDVDLSKVTKNNSMVYTFPTTLFIDDPEKLPKSYKSMWNLLKKKVEEHNNANGVDYADRDAQIMKMSLVYASYIHIENSSGDSRQHYMENNIHLNNFDLDHAKGYFWMDGKDLADLNNDIIHSFRTLIIEIFM